MAYIKTLQSKIDEAQHIRAMLISLKDRFKDAQALEKAILSVGVTDPNLLVGKIEGILDGTSVTLATDISAAVTALAAHSEIWAAKVFVGMLHDPEGLTEFNIDVDVGGTKATITAVQNVTTAIFDVFTIGDIIKISNAEDPDHNGYHTLGPDVATDLVLTLNSVMSGSDNTADTTMIIELFER